MCRWHIINPTSYGIYLTEKHKVWVGAQWTGCSYSPSFMYVTDHMSTCIIQTHTRLMVFKALGFLLCRWKLEHSGNPGLYCYLWYNTLNSRWATSLDFRSCRTHCHHVHLLVRLCERKETFGTRAVFGLGWMVMEKSTFYSFRTLKYLFLVVT